MILASRRDLRQPKLPWVLVQAGRICDGNWDATSWNSIQDQQRLLPLKIKQLAVVSGIDLPMDDSVHIGEAGYPILGLRLAEMAGELMRGGKKLEPRLEKIAFVPSPYGECIDLTFSSVEKGLRAAGEPRGFSLVDAEGKSLTSIYKVTLHGNRARLHATAPFFGLSLRYGHGLNPCCNVTDGRGLPLPLFGPVPLMQPVVVLPFIKTWKATGVLPGETPLGRIACPDLDAFETTVKNFDWCTPEGFINENKSWQGRSGHAYFTSTIELNEPMKLEALMGYDGPFRAWIDGRPLFQELKATNPCLIDRSRKPASLSAGRHRITVAMDLNGGEAWGFSFRFLRQGLSAERIRAKDYVMPVYAAE